MASDVPPDVPQGPVPETPSAAISLESRSGKARTLFGFALTFIYIALSVYYAEQHWSKVIALEPNEVGDLFAGVFAPLAFLWLVLGFLQQGDELRNSVSALLLQSQELNNSVAQQRELVSVTRDQLKLETERANRAEAEASRMAQPIININCGVYMTSGTDLYHSVDVGNAGETCSNLTIHFGNVFPDFTRGTFRAGEQERFTAMLNPGQLKEYPVEASYIDRLGKPGVFKGKLLPQTGGGGLYFVEGD